MFTKFFASTHHLLLGRGRFLLVMLCLSLGACDSRAVWKSLDSKQGGFQVEFPSHIRQSNFQADSVHGPVHVEVASADLGKMNFSMIYMDYPKQALTSQEEVFDHALVGVAEELRGEVLRHYPLESAGHPGRGYELRFGRERKALGHFFLAGRRLYHQQVALPVQQTGSGDQNSEVIVSRFFESLKLE